MVYIPCRTSPRWLPQASADIQFFLQHFLTLEDNYIKGRFNDKTMYNDVDGKSYLALFISLFLYFFIRFLFLFESLGENKSGGKSVKLPLIIRTQTYDRPRRPPTVVVQPRISNWHPRNFPIPFREFPCGGGDWVLSGRTKVNVFVGFLLIWHSTFLDYP